MAQISILEDESFLETSLIDRFPYASRLVSNDVPFQEEIEKIKLFLLEPTQRIQDIEVEISSLQARLDGLKGKTAALKKQVETCRRPITMGRCLPNEMLLEIFFHCLPKSANPTLDTRAAPMLLTAVCQKWRYLAINTSRLWSSIHIPLRMKRTGREGIEADLATNPKMFKEILPLWLGRFSNLPLTFSLVSSHREDRQCLTDCLQALIPFASQWENVCFNGHIGGLLLRFIGKRKARPLIHWQSLKSLFLDFDDQYMYLVIKSMVDVPSLRKVSIRGHRQLNARHLSLPWGRLTHLNILTWYLHDGPNGPLLSPLSGVLNKCKSLIYLGIDIADYHTVRDIKPMSLGTLQRISFRKPTGASMEDEGTCIKFSENLHVPSLRQISMFGLTEGDLSAILSKHGEVIQRLHLNGMDIPIDVLAKNISKCPKILSLSIKINPEKETQQNGNPPELPSFRLRISRDDGCFLSKELIESNLKPFTDKGLLLETEMASCSYEWVLERNSEAWQYADCWRDGDLGQ